jgi:hypothetical protein
VAEKALSGKNAITVTGTITFNATATAFSPDASANKLVFTVDPLSGAASAPTLTFTTFSLVKKGNFIMQDNAVTLTRNTGDTYDNWQGYYNIPSSVTGGKIKEGDVYELTYAFKSNVAMTSQLLVRLVDNSETVNSWKMLSDEESFNNNGVTIPANTTISGTLTFYATGTASSTEAFSNRLIFTVDPLSGAASAPTLTFTTFSLVKKENPHIMQDNAVMLSEQGTSGGNFWQGYYEIPSSVTGGKITVGDVYTLSYSFKSNVAIKGTGGLWANLLDNSEAVGWWKELSSVYHFNNYGEISANTTISGTVTFTATETAYSTSANANRLVFQCNAGTNGATSAPTLTFTEFSFVKQ